MPESQNVRLLRHTALGGAPVASGPEMALDDTTVGSGPTGPAPLGRRQTGLFGSPGSRVRGCSGGSCGPWGPPCTRTHAAGQASVRRFACPMGPDGCGWSGPGGDLPHNATRVPVEENRPPASRSGTQRLSVRLLTSGRAGCRLANLKQSDGLRGSIQVSRDSIAVTLAFSVRWTRLPSSFARPEPTARDVRSAWPGKRRALAHSGRPKTWT